MSKVIQVIKPMKGKMEGNTFVAKPKKRVAAYARVSTDYEDQINSYKVQCDEYTKIIQSNPDYIYAGIFADQGLSGTQAKKRPEFMKMIESAKMGEIDLILTKSISRFARNTVDTITYVRELRELGVEVFFEKENLSSLDPKIDFMLTILSSIAQEESRSISTNVKWTYDKKFQKGIVDPRRIYGYEVVDGKQVIKEDEALVVRQMFTLAIKRYKISDIVKTLNVEGIKTLKGSTWTYGAIRHILQNEKYCGDAVLRKTVTIDYLTKKSVKNDNIADKYYVTDNHEPIVSKEVFAAVQLILKDNTKEIRNTNKTTKYPLTGILYCPRCGRSLKRQQVNRGENMRVVLNCNHSYGNDYNCPSGSPDYDIVLAAAFDSVKSLYANNQALNSLFDVFDNHVALKNLRDELSKLKNDNINLLSLHHDNPENVDIYNQIEHNNKRISILEQDLVVNVSSSVRLDYIKSLVEDEHLSEQAVVLKDFYSLVLADDKKVTFVISPTKCLDTLVSSIHEINETESMLSKMFIDKSGTKGIFYEVKIYE